MSTAQSARTPFRVKAMSFEACNCKHGCNCQFGGFPNEGKCEFIIAYQVKDGRFGDIPLNGLRAVVVGKYPGAIHQGHGHVALFIDEKANPQQVEALATIFSGKMGGMPWEALAGTIERLDGPFRKPIEIHDNGTRSEVRIAGAIDLRLTPFLNPVSGEEKEVHITYPKGGFFWNDGNICTTSAMRAESEGLKIEWPERYAAAAEVNWTNQA